MTMAPASPWATSITPTGSPADLARLPDVEAGAQPFERRQEPEPVRIEADALEAHRRPRQGRRCRRPDGRWEGSPGTDRVVAGATGD